MGEQATLLSKGIAVVGRVITKLTAERADFISNEKIVVGLFGDKDGQALMASWGTVDPNVKSLGDSAINIVAWFSAVWTKEENFQWKEVFDRSSSKPYSYRRKTLLEVADSDPDWSAWEGAPLVRRHVRRERSRTLRKAKLEQARASGEPLACEVCEEVLETTYPGPSGDVMEVHHRLPLSSQNSPGLKTLNDLALLCPTCHRAIHRTEDAAHGIMTVEQFRLSLSSAKV